MYKCKLVLVVVLWGSACGGVAAESDVCGDEIVGAGETCDDGNTTDGDGCSAACQVETAPQCGDGTVDATEVCDDGNTTGGDGCSSDCRSEETCGNSVVDPGEVCDDGNIVAGDGCNTECTSDESCGNGFRDPGEACDDGNTVNGDSCSSFCQSGIHTIALGYHHTCALLTGGLVKCWGENAFGQLGLGDQGNRGDELNEMGDSLPAVDLGTDRTAVAITAGDSYTCALLDNGAVKCWGDNLWGKLGLGDFSHRGDGPGEMGDNLPAVDLGTGRTAVFITTGDQHTCALLDNGAVKCWGANSAGELGLGDTNHRGDEPGEMGDNLPAVDLGTGRTPVALAAGGSHTCALLDDGSVTCWGYNSAGELGLGDTAARGDEPEEMGDNLPAVDLGTGRTPVGLTLGGGHVCALLEDGSITCWGHNAWGQLGFGDTTWRGDDPGEMGDNLPLVSLGSGLEARAVAAGFFHTCALLTGASIKCWGANNYGQLGLGDTIYRGDLADEMGDNLPAADLGTDRTSVEISLGYDHTCALLDNASLKCWGNNLFGQLGLGDIEARGDGADEMGDSLPAVDVGM